jgi:pimeloyl-ACP methyl ester carboxylesterase
LYATRAAAFEPRIRSVVISSAPDAVAGLFSGAELVSEDDDSVVHFLQTMFLAVTGSETARQAADRLAPFAMHDDILTGIRIPLLALYGGDDGMVDAGVGERVIAQISSSDKKLVFFPSGTPGSHHCQQDSVAAAEPELSAWISRTV